MTEHLCVIATCMQPQQHLESCLSKRCRGCRPRIAEHPNVCNVDRNRMAGWLGDIPRFWADLTTEPDLTDRREWMVRQDRRNPEAAKPRWLRKDHANPGLDKPRWKREPGHDPLAQTVPAGPITTTSRAQISGSRTAPDVTNLDTIDLTGPARAATLAIVGVASEHPDQIGHLSVATELDFWVRDWITILPNAGDHLPVPTVPALAAWLAVRLPKACDNHAAIDEFAAKLGTIHHAMRSALGLTDPPKELCVGVGCRSCDRKALFRDGTFVQCQYCGQFYNEREYREWVGLLAGQARRMT